MDYTYKFLKNSEDGYTAEDITNAFNAIHSCLCKK